MINRKNILITLSALFLLSCEDDSHKLSGGYSFWSNGPLSISPYPTMFYKGIDAKITDYEYDSNFILVEQKPELDNHIYTLSFRLGTNYSILKDMDSSKTKLEKGEYEFYQQKLVEDSALYRRMNNLGVTSENTISDMGTCEILADSIVRNDPYYQDIFSREVNYWIIVHGEPQEYFYLPSSEVLGPYSKEEYLAKRKELGVSEDLKLDFEE